MKCGESWVKIVNILLLLKTKQLNSGVVTHFEFVDFVEPTVTVL